jgi:hypothetical protein
MSELPDENPLIEALNDHVVVNVYRPEADGDPMSPHAFGPFTGVEIYAILPSGDAESLVDRLRMHNPSWSFCIEPITSDALGAS